MMRSVKTNVLAMIQAGTRWTRKVLWVLLLVSSSSSLSNMETAFNRCSQGISSDPARLLLCRYHIVLDQQSLTKVFGSHIRVERTALRKEDLEKLQMNNAYHKAPPELQEDETSMYNACFRRFWTLTLGGTWSPKYHFSGYS